MSPIRLHLSWNAPATRLSIPDGGSLVAALPVPTEKPAGGTARRSHTEVEADPALQ